MPDRNHRIMNSRLLTTDLLLALLGLFIPPFPVIIKRGLFSLDTVINVALSFLGGIPGVVHSWYIVVKYPDDGIPFFDTRRNHYDIIPDEERLGRQEGGFYPAPQTYNPPQPQVATPPVQDLHHQQHQQQDSQEHGQQGGSSSQHPPPSYGSVVVPGDHKIQYNDDSHNV